MLIWKEFTFEAAHFLPSAVGDPFNPNGRMHGHSFLARVFFEGEPDKETGLVANLGDVAELLSTVKFRLDHHNLNQVLAPLPPTLENVAMFIGISCPMVGHHRNPVRVEVSRPTCGEGAIWERA